MNFPLSKGFSRSLCVFFTVSVIVLLCTSAFKVWSVYGNVVKPAFLRHADPVFVLIEKRHAMLVAAALELVTCCFVISAGNPRLRVLALLWLSAVFLVYRTAASMLEPSQSCRCLGELPHFLNMNTDETLSKMILAYLVVGSAAFLILMRFNIRKVATKKAFWLVLGSYLSTPLFAGDVTGTIRYSGKPVPAQMLKRSADQGCGTLDGENERVIRHGIRDGQVLSNSLVFLQLSDASVVGSLSTQVVSHSNCLLEPQLLVLTPHSTLVVTNLDSRHCSIYSSSIRNRAFSITLGKGEGVVRIFENIERPFALKCETHRDTVFIAVLPDRRFAVTDSEGRYRIPAPGKGTYQLYAFHPRLGYQAKTVTVNSDETTADFIFSRP